MKRMDIKLEIAVTALIMFVIGVVISGIYSVVSMNSSFFTFDVLITGLILDLFYLGYILINIRQNRLFTLIVLFCICITFIFVLIFYSSKKDISSSFNWKYAFMGILCTISYTISLNQSDKLLEENITNDEEIENKKY